MGIWLVVRLIPDEVLHDARGRVDDQLERPKPVSWGGAAVVVLGWLVAAVVVAVVALRLG